MKNVHSILHLFGEQRMVFANAETTDLKKIETEYFGNNAEDLGEKEKRLADIDDFLTNEKNIDEKMKDVELETSPVEITEDKKFFGLGDLYVGLNQLAKQMGLSPSQQILKQNDLKKSFDQKLTLQEVERLRAQEKSTSIFLKKETKENGENYIAIIGKNEKGEGKGLVHFSIQSEFTKETLKKKDTILEEIRKERKQIQEQVAEEMAAMGKLNGAFDTFLDSESKRDAIKDSYELNIVENQKLNIVGLTYTAKSNPNWPLIRIDTAYQYKPGQKNNFQTRIFRTTPSGESLEIKKYPASGEPLPERNQLYADIDMALSQTEVAEATKPATQEELKKQKEKSVTKKEEIKEQETPAITVEPHTGAKKVKEAKIEEKNGETLLVITTKKGSKFEYKQLKDKPIWEYTGKDKDEGGEYYLDDGTRVESDGSQFVADKEKKKKQTKSKIIGQETGTISRKKAPETKEVEFKLTDETGMEKPREETEASLKTVKAEIDEAFDKSDNEYDLKDKLTRITAPLKSQKEIQSASFAVEGGRITWDRDSGFKVEDTEKDKKKRVEELKNAGLEILSPEKVEEIGLLEFNSLKNINRELKNTVENGENAYEILTKIEELGNRTKSALVNSEISKMKLGELTWDENNGFGEKPDLLNTIYDLKKQQLGEDSEEYETFWAKSKKELVKNRGKALKEKSKDYYSRALDELTNDTHLIDEDVMNLEKDDFVKNWQTPNFSGRKSAVELTMGKPPFLYENVKVPGAIWEAVIKPDGFAEKDGANFEDLFNHEKSKFIQMYSNGESPVIPSEYFKDSETFIKAFKKLSTSNDPDDEKTTKVMFGEIIMPCLDILKSLSTVEYSEKESEGVSENIKETDPEQIEIDEGIKKLCNFEENGATTWEGFINTITGGNTEETLTMQTIDGKKSFMDKGIFLRHNSPKAAYESIRNRKGLYTLGENGKKMDKAKTLEEINRLMKLGYTNLELEGKSLSPKQAENFENFTKEQMLAFQLGYIVDQASRSNAQMKESLDIIAKTTDPVIVELLRVMMEKGIAPKYLTEIRDAIVAGVGIGVEIKNGEASLTGVGGGINIPLSDGLSLVIGAGGSPEGLSAGVGLNITVYKGSKLMVSVPVGVSTEGIGAGVNATVQILGRDVSFGTGVGIGFGGAIGVGGGVLIELEDMTKKAEEKVQESLDSSTYAKLWEEWKKLPDTASVETKYAKLKEIKSLYNKVAEIQKKYGSTDADIVFMLELVKERIVAESFNDLDRFFITHVGFGVSVGAGGVTALPTVGFNLGGVEVFIPNRREIAKIMSQLSDIRVKNNLEQSLEKIEESLKNGVATEGSFIEKTPDLTYDPSTGRLLSLVESDEIDLSHWQTDIEAKNKNLAEAEIELKELEGNKVELVVKNTEDKDAQIIVDPTLSSIAVIKDKNHLYLAGNVNDLIITRERFTTPYQVRADGPATFDRIIVRQKSSVTAGNDINFMLAHSVNTLRKNMGDKEFTIEDGALNAGGDLNIFEVAGYMNAKTEDIPPELRSIVEFYKEQTPDLAATLNKEELGAMAENTKARREAIGTRTKAKNKEETLKIDENLNDGLDKLFGKIKKEFEKSEYVGGDPTKVGSLITKNWPKELGELSSNKLAYAVTYIQNKWYSQFAKTKQGREKLLKHLESRRKWVHDNIILPTFRDLKKTLKLESSPENMAKDIVDKMYGELEKQLKDPNFDFSKLEVKTIPEHSMFASGSWGKGEKGKEGVYTKNVDYRTLPKAKELLHDFGFLDGTTTTYDLASDKQVERDIARALLEIASPIPEATEAIKLLDSPLAVKIATLQTLELLIKDPENVTKLYQALKNGEESLEALLNENKEMQGTVARFRDLLMEIRASQISGKPFIRKIGQTGLTVKISMNTNIVAGAYTKCINPSHYIEEVGTVQVLSGTQSLYEESTEVTDVGQSKTFATLLATAGIKKTEVEKPKPEEPEKPGGKYPSKTTKAVAGKASVSEKNKGGAQPKGPTLTYEGEAAGLDKALGNK